MAHVPNPAETLFAWVGARTDERRWLSPAVAGIGSITAAALLAFPSFWTVALAALSLSIVTLTETAASWWRAQEEKSSGNAVVDAYVQIHTALIPLAQAVSNLVQEEGRKPDLFGQICKHGVDSCATQTGDESVRAQLFTVDSGGTSMSRIAHGGRLGDSAGFDRGAKRGQDAFKTLEHGQLVHVRDIEKDREERPRAWSGSGDGYRSFVTAPISVGREGYGLLTVDSPEANAFSVTDEKFVGLVAAILGAALVQRAKMEATGEGR